MPLSNEEMVFNSVRTDKKDLIHICSDTHLRLNSIARSLVNLRSQEKVIFYPNLFTKLYKAKARATAPNSRIRIMRAAPFEPRDAKILASTVGLLYPIHLAETPWDYHKKVLKAIIATKRAYENVFSNMKFYFFDSQHIHNSSAELVRNLRTVNWDSRGLEYYGFELYKTNWIGGIGMGGERVTHPWQPEDGRVEGMILCMLPSWNLSPHYEYTENEDLSGYNQCYRMIDLNRFVNLLDAELRSRTSNVARYESIQVNAYLKNSEGNAYTIEERGLSTSYMQEKMRRAVQLHEGRL